MLPRLPAPAPDSVQRPQFSLQIPGFQTVWDSTSAKALQQCPRYYWFRIVWGYASKESAIQLRFGIAAHSINETFLKWIASGVPYEEALHSIAYWTLRNFHSFDAAGDPIRNRDSLLRFSIWLPELLKSSGSPLTTFRLPDGSPAVEHHFVAALPFEIDGPVWWAGHLDHKVWDGTAPWLEDLKTTGYAFSDTWHHQFLPGIQFPGYLYGDYVSSHTPALGIFALGVQIGRTFIRAQRIQVHVTPDQLSEWLSVIETTIIQARQLAETENWPPNFTSCFRCEFRSLCRRPPTEWPQMLANPEGPFTWSPWNPTIPRTVKTELSR